MIHPIDKIRRNQRTYTEMVTILRSGQRLPASQIDRVLLDANLTLRHLVNDVLVSGAPLPGDPCPQCGERFGVLNSTGRGDKQIRYIGCRSCGHRPAKSKQIVPRACLTRLRSRRNSAPIPDCTDRGPSQ